MRRALWNVCDLKDHIDTDRIGRPQPDPLPLDDRDISYYIIADEAFALQPWLMKPLSGRHLDHAEIIFNSYYRMSRAMGVVENAFGILANRFGCLLITLK